MKLKLFWNAIIHYKNLGVLWFHWELDWQLRNL